MEQEQIGFKKCSILKRKKINTASEEKIEAHLLDYMQKHPELTPEPPSPPPGEFQMIMEEINRRGTKLLIRKQLQILNNCRRVVYYLHKPFIITMMVCVLVSVSSIGVSAERADKYHRSDSLYSRKGNGLSRERQAILNENNINNAYVLIYRNLKSRPLKIRNTPYLGQTVCFLQAAYNNFFHKDFLIEKQGFSNGVPVYSTEIFIDGTYYNLSSNIPESEFEAILEKLSD